MKHTVFTAAVAALSILLTLSCLSVFAAEKKTRSLCDLHHPSDDRIQWECRKLKWGEKPEKLFGNLWQEVLRFNRLDRHHFVGGLSIKVPVRLEDVSGFTPLPRTYPYAAADAKFILVDQSEMFLGAYEHGRLVYSFPIAIGIERHRVYNGEFRVDAVDRWHESNMYKVHELGAPYPMHYGLRFYVEKSKEDWPSFWIHGRDLVGYPASHGCIGLYDEEMQNRLYKDPKDVILQDAKALYDWVVNGHPDDGKFHKIDYGPRVLVLGTPPA